MMGQRQILSDCGANLPQKCAWKTAQYLIIQPNDVLISVYLLWSKWRRCSRPETGTIHELQGQKRNMERCGIREYICAHNRPTTASP